MPNWCWCTLVVQGSDLAEVERFAERNAGSDGPLSFERSVPVPAWVNQSEEVGEVRMDDDISWYGWRLKNWGCKWDLALDVQLVSTPYQLTYAFTTAWSPPVPLGPDGGQGVPHPRVHPALVERGHQRARRPRRPAGGALMPVKVSLEVLGGLEAVRRSGLTNMLDRPAVARIAEAMGFSSAAGWVRDHRADYAEGVFRGFEADEEDRP